MFRLEGVGGRGSLLMSGVGGGRGGGGGGGGGGWGGGGGGGPGGWGGGGAYAGFVEDGVFLVGGWEEVCEPALVSVVIGVNIWN